MSPARGPGRGLPVMAILIGVCAAPVSGQDPGFTLRQTVEPPFPVSGVRLVDFAGDGGSDLLVETVIGVNKVLTLSREHDPTPPATGLNRERGGLVLERVGQLEVFELHGGGAP